MDAVPFKNRETKTGRQKQRDGTKTGGTKTEGWDKNREGTKTEG